MSMHQTIKSLNLYLKFLGSLLKIVRTRILLAWEWENKERIQNYKKLGLNDFEVSKIPVETDIQLYVESTKWISL